MPADTPHSDYRDTLNLPRTDFPMRAGLPAREPGWLARWEEIGIYARLRASAAGRVPFVLHDGPPYANGHLHIGHALNKVIKDIIVRSHQMMGFDARYVPGWDCHGLPIEWKIEEQYRAKGLDKDAVDIIAFRQECRKFAEGWIDIQREEFKRLGVTGNWADPYLTMAFHAEAVIADEFMKLVMNGSLYQGSKPVMWSPVEKTALAEAEVEYHDVTSHQVWVRFPMAGGAAASVVIWTTTPWTIPQNRAVAYGSDIAYGLYRVDAVAENAQATPGETLFLADALAEAVMRAARVEAFTRLRDVAAAELGDMTLAHPYRGIADGNGEWDYDVPMVAGDHVTDAPVALRGEPGDEPDDRDAVREPVHEPQRPPPERTAESGQMAVALAHHAEPDETLADGEAGDPGQHGIVQEPEPTRDEERERDLRALPDEDLGVGRDAGKVGELVDPVAFRLGAGGAREAARLGGRQQDPEEDDGTDRRVDDPRTDTPADDGGGIGDGGVGGIHQLPPVKARRRAAPGGEGWRETTMAPNEEMGQPAQRRRCAENRSGPPVARSRTRSPRSPLPRFVAVIQGATTLLANDMAITTETTRSRGCACGE